MEERLNLLRKVNDFLIFITIKFIIIFMLILVFSTFLQVFSRYILKNPFVWTSEVSTFSFIWIVFLGAAVGVRNSKHFSIEIIYQILPEGLIKFFKYFIQFAIFVSANILVIEGYRFTILGLLNISPTLGIRMCYMYMSIPLSGIMMFIFTLENIYYLYIEKY